MEGSLGTSLRSAMTIFLSVLKSFINLKTINWLFFSAKRKKIFMMYLIICYNESLKLLMVIFFPASDLFIWDFFQLELCCNIEIHLIERSFLSSQDLWCNLNQQSRGCSQSSAGVMQWAKLIEVFRRESWERVERKKYFFLSWWERVLHSSHLSSYFFFPSFSKIRNSIFFPPCECLVTKTKSLSSFRILTAQVTFYSQIYLLILHIFSQFNFIFAFLLHFILLTKLMMAIGALGLLQRTVAPF